VLEPDRLCLAVESLHEASVGIESGVETHLQLVHSGRHWFVGIILEAEFAIVEAERLSEQWPVEVVWLRVLVLPSRDPRLQCLPARQCGAAASCHLLKLDDQPRLRPFPL